VGRYSKSWMKSTTSVQLLWLRGILWQDEDCGSRSELITDVEQSNGAQELISHTHYSRPDVGFTLHEMVLQKLQGRPCLPNRPNASPTSCRPITVRGASTGVHLHFLQLAKRGQKLSSQAR
jgi:hypothetical protein